MLKGKIDSLNDRFNFEKPNCVSGSYFYNGSCYFISNHRANVNNLFSQSSNILLTQILNNDKATSLLPTSVVLPNQANWLNSSSFCKKLNNESSLIYFDNYEEYEFLIDLLFKLKFNNNETDFKKEEAFYLGMYYNQSSMLWTWLNDINLNKSFFLTPNSSAQMPLLAQLAILGKRPSEYIYRPCAYLNIRGNRDIDIDNSNCDIDQKPYICKYGKHYWFHSVTRYSFIIIFSS